MEPKDLLPFVLEEALKEPHRVVTRSMVHKVGEINISEFQDAYPLTVEIDGVALSFTREGKYFKVFPHKKDLFLLPKTVIT